MSRIADIAGEIHFRALTADVQDGFSAGACHRTGNIGLLDDFRITLAEREFAPQRRVFSDRQ